MSRLFVDVETVFWKEWKEFVRQRSTLVGILFFVGVFGVFIPLQRGHGWLDGSAPFVNALIFPATLVLGIVADSFAGEKERHTLETLLASRLSDRAILFGKFAAIVAYTWGLTMSSLVIGAIAVNVRSGFTDFAFYPARLVIASVTFGALTAGLTASAGILISLRSSTVRQAAQILSIGIMIFFFAVFGAIAAAPKEWRSSVGSKLEGLGPGALFLSSVAVLVLLDAVLLTIATLRFQRTRLILD